MMPPTSIDGTDITGATIDGTDVQEITVDGQTVFTAGPDIPDSEADQKLDHRWLLDDLNGTVKDLVGNTDGTNNGVSSINGDWAGGSAGDGDGVDDYINSNWQPTGTFLENDFAIAFSFSTQDSGASFFDCIANGNMWLGIGYNFLDSDINFVLRSDNSNTDNSRINTDQSFNDGGTYRLVCNKITNDPSNWEIWINQTEESVSVGRNELVVNDLIDMDEPLFMFARNTRGNDDLHLDGIIDDICVFNSSLTQSEIESYQNPFN